jgi:outer membrane protein assembly factor BamB
MYRAKKFLLLILLPACALALLPAAAGAWQTTITDYPGRGQAVAVDRNGDVIATGGILYGSDVVKLSGATGEEMWRFNASNYESRTYASDLALDSDGDAFVVFSWSRSVLKIDGSTGTLLWAGTVGGTANAFQPLINAVAVDGDGNVITAGTVGGLFNVCKLRGTDGAEVWRYEREGLAKDVAVGASGDVAAAGIMGGNFGVVKLRGDGGQELWEREIDGAGNFSHVFEEANAVAMDADGSVAVAGVTSNEVANFRDFTVAKYGPDGRVRWVEIIDGQYVLQNDRGERFRQSNDIGNAVAIDSEGNVVAAGSLQEHDRIPADSNAPEHFHAVKIAREGGIIWSTSAAGNFVYGHAFALSLDPSGNVIAAGDQDGSLAVVKFSGPGGRVLWTRAAAGPIARGVAVDGAGDVAATGETLGADRFSRFAVLKLRGVNGADYFADPTPPDVPETVLKYAPLVYLHSGDEYRPGDPTTFINNSALLWFHEGGCGPELVAEGGAVRPERLGRQAAGGSTYSHRAILPRTSDDAPCLHSNVAFSAADHTRPHDGSKRSGPENNYWWDNPFYEREGFYLDLSDSQTLRRGMSPPAADRPGAPVFYEYVQHRYVTYWFFYPYNQFRAENPENGFSRPVQEHEGDWERVSIQLDQDDRPVNVNYHSHDDGSVVPWDLVDKFDGTHPVVFSAKGSHASYPAADEYQTLCFDRPVINDEVCALDRTDYGPMWPTWRNLSDVGSQPWYGFGGAWGAVDALDTPFGSFLGPHFTGPLGPSPYKNSKGHWSPRIGGRVTDLDGKGLAGVTVKAVDTEGRIAGEAETCREGAAPACLAGSYSLDDLTFGRSYTVVASKDGYSFTPVVRVFVNLRDKQTADFQVLDTTPPILHLPPDISVDARVPEGATVYYTVTAADDVTALPRISCRPLSGVIFPVGVTTVSCTAVDEAGNSAAGDFKVTVRGAAEQLGALVTTVRSLGLPQGVETSLLAQLQTALDAFRRGSPGAACNSLNAFDQHVRAQSGKKITTAQAGRMLEAAGRIKGVMGCGQ